MTEVAWSTWSPTAPRIDGSIVDGEWSGAGVVPLPGHPGGTVLVQNDARFLYVGIDLPEDTEPTPDPADYFWFSVDIDQDGAITPNVDLNYAQMAPSHLVLQHYLGPNQWTPALPDQTDSVCARGFGPSSLDTRPHATWTARLDLGELEAVPGGVVFFGLRVSSADPPVTHDVPDLFFTDFSSLVKLHLAERPTIPAELAGDVLAGVGLVPATQIVDGYASTHPGYYPHVEDAAFGGLLNLIGNGDTLARLWAAGARRYRILHQYAGGGFTPIDQAWTNYLRVGRRYQPRPFGPDAAHTYPLTDPNDEYSVDDLLLQWNSTTFSSGLHDFRAEFFAADGTPVPVGTDQALILMVDNGQPVVRVDAILAPDGTPVQPCDFVLLEKGEGVQIVVTATEPRGHLLDWRLTAEYGNATPLDLGGASYPAGSPPRDRRWYGATRVTMPADGPFDPPRTCAYLFRVRAGMRVTNGYTPYIGGAATFQTLTLVRS